MEELNLTHNSSLNSTESECFKWNRHFIYFLIPTGFLFLVYSCLVTRTKFYPKICYGRPGAIYPYNSVDGHADRITIICTTVIAVTFIIRLIFGESILPIIEDSHNYRGLISLLNILVLASLYYPILASASLGHSTSYFLGTLYIWAYAITYIKYVFTGCRDDDEKYNASYYHIIKSLPTMACLLYLMILFPYKLVSVIHRKFTNAIPTINEKVPYQMMYVKKVLFRKKEEKADMDSEKFWKRMWINFTDKFYRPLPGFRYSSRMLSSVTVGSVIVYILSWKLLYLFWRKRNTLCNIENIKASFQRDPELTNVSSLDNMKGFGIDDIKTIGNPVAEISVLLALRILSGSRDFKYLHYQCEAIYAWSTLTIIICDVALVTIICLLLTTYRNNLVDMYRGQCTLPKFKSESNTSILLGCIRLAGYQTAALLWGFVLQCIVMWILLALIIEVVVIPIKFGYFLDVLKVIVGFWPIFLVPIIIILIQLLMVRFFLQRKGAVLALDNRRLLFNFMYFMFFYNIIKGLLLTILRLIKFIIVGSWLMSRLDTSCLSRLDGGIKTYVNFLIIENLQNNPIMNVALYFLAHRSNDYSTTTFTCITVIPNKRIILRNRWWLFWMLYKNPSLQTLRLSRMAVSHILRENFLVQANMVHYMFKVTNENECVDQTSSTKAINEIPHNIIHDKFLNSENKDSIRL